MADTNTTRLGLLKMEIDSHENDWGAQININFDELDEAIGGQSTHNTTGGTTTLDIDDIRPPFHRVTGVLASHAIFEVPAANPKLFFWRNETTGNFSVTVKVNGQTGVAVPRGETVLLRTNGTDVVHAGVDNYKLATAVAGTADAITATFSPAYHAYATAMRFRFVAPGANTITNPTINVDSLGAKTIKKLNAQALEVGDIAGAGHVCECVYDGTNVLLLNPVHLLGLPTGGAKGQALVKASAANFDAAWANAREMLTADTTFYIRTDGNNANDGRTNNAGGAFLTIQGALDSIAARFDAAGHTITVQIADGAYSTGCVVPRIVGVKAAANLVIQGNIGTPGNVTVTATSADCVYAADGAVVTIQGMALATATEGCCLHAMSGGVIRFNNIEFGSSAGQHMLSEAFGNIIQNGPYSVTGNTGTGKGHAFVGGGNINLAGTCTLVGTRDCKPWFNALYNGTINLAFWSFTGTAASGSRGVAQNGGGLLIFGTTLPGSTGPSVTSPGWTI